MYRDGSKFIQILSGREASYDIWATNQKEAFIGRIRVVLRTLREAEQQNLETGEKSGCKADPLSTAICLREACSLALCNFCMSTLFCFIHIHVCYVSSGQNCVPNLALVGTYNSCLCVTNQLMIDFASQFHVIPIPCSLERESGGLVMSTQPEL